MSKPKGKITGIGGVFLTSSDPDALKSWYTEKMGLETDKYGHVFQWRQLESPEKRGSTQWSVMNADTDYFKPGKQEFMINYRIENLEEYLEELTEKGVTVVGEIEKYDYGKFAWVLDQDGNKIELWEPVDEVFDEFVDNSQNS